MSTYKMVEKDGITTIEVGDLDAEMLVAAYVPDFQELGLTFAEAYDLACERDRDAADGLEMDCCNGTQDLTAKERAYAEKVNALFAQTENEDLRQAKRDYGFIMRTLRSQPVAMEAVAA